MKLNLIGVGFGCLLLRCAGLCGLLAGREVLAGAIEKVAGMVELVVDTDGVVHGFAMFAGAALDEGGGHDKYFSMCGGAVRRELQTGRW